MVGNNQNCKAIATRLQAHGLQVKAILHPTVPLGKERLRICLHAYNTVEEVDMLFELLGGQ